jgi:GntP family gluconate:H+ symporter
MAHNTVLLLCALVSVLGLVVLIARFKLNAFVALVLASIFVGVCSALTLPRPEAWPHLQGIGRAFGEGVGNVLASVAMVVGLGTILGKLLAESGGAEVVARWLIGRLGKERMPWAMVLIAFLVGIPVWFTVGLVLLVPLLFTLVKESGKPMLLLGIPLLAGLSAAHSLVPPHPGPLAAIGVLHADAGRTILYSLIIGFPTAVVGGPLFAKFITRYVVVAPGELAVQLSEKSERKRLPGLGMTMFTILLPVGLMMAASAADLVGSGQTPAWFPWLYWMIGRNPVRAWLDLIGHPTVAMLIAVLLALYSFGAALGFRKETLLKFTNDCLAPVAMVLLVVGGGGGFSKTLEYCGVGRAITASLGGAQFSPLVLGWLIACLLRLATGSATVSITTAAGIMAPVVTGLPGVNLELLVIAMGAGSGIFSHLNDGGFWFVKEYFNMTVPQTLKTWTVLTTIKSVTALLLALTLNALLK